MDRRQPCPKGGLACRRRSLEIRIGDAPLSVTIPTPGHDLELAARFLIAEVLIERGEQIVSLHDAAAEKQCPREFGQLNF